METHGKIHGKSLQGGAPPDVMSMLVYVAL